MIDPSLALAGWVPYRIRADQQPPVVDWCFIGDDTFTEPFFEETIARCVRTSSPERRPRETSIETLLEWRTTQPGIAPTAFIFHCSRCGSTLVSQMAAALPRTIAISEPVPFDDALRARVPDAVRIDWLRAVISALGQPRRGDEQHLFVKFDAWHTMDLPLVQQAFPGVPCMFLYREPAAVIASQMRMPGLHMLPGTVDPSLLGLDLEGVSSLTREERCGRVLAAIYAAGLAHATAGRVTLMNYAQLPDAASRQLLEWCGLTAREDLDERLRQIAQFDAKTRGLPYIANATPRWASRPAFDAAARLIDVSYRHLELMRLDNRV